MPPPARIRTKSTYNCSDENYDNLVVADSDSIVSASMFLSACVSIQFSLQSFSSAFHSLCTPRISLPSALLQFSHAQFCRPPSTDCKYYLGGGMAEKERPAKGGRAHSERAHQIFGLRLTKFAQVVSALAISH